MLKTTQKQLKQCPAELESLHKEAKKLRTENDLLKQIVLNKKGGIINTPGYRYRLFSLILAYKILPYEKPVPSSLPFGL